MRAVVLASALAAGVSLSSVMSAQQRDSVAAAGGDSVNIRLVDVDLQAAVQSLSRYLDRPVVLGNVSNVRVTIETPRPVPRADVTRLLRGVLESQSFELVADSAAGIYRVQRREVQARQLGPPAPDPTAQRPQGPLELFVIHLRHARAADVAATVNALYGRGGALGELGEGLQTLPRELEAQQVPPGLPPPPGAVAAVSGRQASLAGDVTIVPDPRANSLLVRASRADFTLIQAAVNELDVRPLQVLIEVIIAEVRKDRRLDFGTEVKVPKTRVRGTENTTVEGTTTGLGLGDFAIKVMGLGGVDAEVTLRAAASRGNVRILSRPVILAANNEEAEINVGSQRPFVQVARVLPTDNTARDQVVQYRDVGTRLRVLPTISTDGHVMLRVIQEVNAATSEVAFDAPIISTRSVETRLLVNDRQTVVLGGLSDRQREATQGGVPVLSSIPWLGGLFGRVGRRTTETELFLFITPRVIRSDEEAEAATEPLRKKAEEAKP